MTHKDFESSCLEYLNKNFKQENCEFVLAGGSDSTKPDIEVVIDGKTMFTIEVKEPAAQCSQFVVLPDEEKRSFIYSELNRPEKPSNPTQAIIAEMNKNYNKYKPSPKEMGLSAKLYSDRIVDYYKNYKNSRFFITREEVEKGDFIILPTEKISEYFTITACYRRKRSGSHNPNQKEIQKLDGLLPMDFVNGYEVEKVGKYTNIIMNPPIKGTFIREGELKAQFKPIEGSKNKYRMTILGTTNNPNVIFSIRLKTRQRQEDIQAFKNAIGLG